MHLKVERDRQRGMCVSCRNAHIVEYENGDTQTICFQYGSPGMRIRRPVLKCNEYDHRGRQTNHEMEKIAWVVRTDRSGKTIGFKAPQKKEDD